MSIIRKLLNQQMNVSKRFDECFLSKKFLIDGNSDYLQDFLPNILEKTPICSTVYDIGCGKNPAISIEIKEKLQAKVIGVDLSANELS